MKLRDLFFVPVMASALFGCSGAQDAPKPDAPPEGKLGSLQFALTGSDSAGVPYRLRNASFEIYGSDGYPYPYPPYYYGPGGAASSGGSTGAAGAGDIMPMPDGTGGAGGASNTNNAPNYRLVSSETDPDSATISTRLVPGGYYVNLENDDWYLEKVTPKGVEPVTQSVLLSDRMQYTYVWDQGTTDVYYRFGVDGQLIDFRHGDLNVDIQIEHPGENQGTGGVPVYQDGGVIAPGPGGSPASAGGATGL